MSYRIEPQVKVADGEGFKAHARRSRNGESDKDVVIVKGGATRDSFDGLRLRVASSQGISLVAKANMPQGHDDDTYFTSGKG